MAATEKLLKEGKFSEVTLQAELVPIINAVVSNIKRVNDYPIPEYKSPEFSFKAGINDALRQILKRYWSDKIQAFYSQF